MALLVVLTLFAMDSKLEDINAIKKSNEFQAKLLLQIANHQ